MPHDLPAPQGGSSLRGFLLLSLPVLQLLRVRPHALDAVQLGVRRVVHDRRRQRVPGPAPAAMGITEEPQNKQIVSAPSPTPKEFLFIISTKSLVCLNIRNTSCF